MNVLQEAKQQIDPRLAEMVRYGGGGGGRFGGGGYRGRGGGGGGYRGKLIARTAFPVSAILTDNRRRQRPAHEQPSLVNDLAREVAATLTWS